MSLTVYNNGSPEPLLSVCVPTLDYISARTRAFEHAVVANTPILLPYETVVADCEGELLGYTKPMNAAMAAARGEFLAALNDDVEVAPGWAEALLEPFANPDVWCVTPDATHTDGPQVFHPWCMFWRAEAWRELGGLDERFVLWGSDIDIARRLIDAGHPPVKVSLTVPVRHELNATSREHVELGPISAADLERFRAKWGTSAEEEKHRLTALVGV